MRGPIDTYDIGDLMTVWRSYTIGGVATDPTAVTVTVKRGDGSTFTGSVVRTLSPLPTGAPAAATGVYYAQFSATVSGHWDVRWVATGTGQEAYEDHFYVRKSYVLSGEHG